jgi:hypothetical protein
VPAPCQSLTHIRDRVRIPSLSVSAFAHSAQCETDLRNAKQHSRDSAAACLHQDQQDPFSNLDSLFWRAYGMLAFRDQST